MLIERLVLGTARLTGGASEGEALRLVRHALDAGIEHIDSAPSYGMGTAEAVIGKALRQAGPNEVRVTAKLGSARDPLGRAKSVGRRIKRALATRRDPLETAPQLAQPLRAPTGNDFSPAAMRASLALSRERLGRIDVLLLHDICEQEVTAAVLEAVGELAQPLGASPGYASRGPWEADLDARFPAGWIAQCAMQPGWPSGSAAARAGRSSILHGIVGAGAYSRANAPGFAEALDTAARIVGGQDMAAARIAALFARAAVSAPAARLIVASSHCDRLLAVLGAIRRIDDAGSAREIAEALAPPQPR